MVLGRRFSHSWHPFELGRWLHSDLNSAALSPKGAIVFIFQPSLSSFIFHPSSFRSFSAQVHHSCCRETHIP